MFCRDVGKPFSALPAVLPDETARMDCVKRNHIAAFRICHCTPAAPIGECLSGILS
ncbi:hypothetical protein SJA_C2-00080 [Sphingobium indicum UT26S]|uniref:Uncharacterized protein n=1 Tax=Sphingobium indicum (strain DSM 16413 / CCM 7287 / MTCC 6362 / UT26 / NBRC 101211 / UT26S) TaxID=452662 RepID=D4Z7A2_SPHIU|nr:hypothetical protein SJA_C2-00080 [Sphingobium indicum UT26S]